MANICTTSVMARGFKSEKDALECKRILESSGTNGELWTNLFDAMTSYYCDPDKGWIVTADGWTRWNADSLLDGPDYYSLKKDDPTFMTIPDLAKQYGVYFEILGEESGNNSGEHYGISPTGDLALEEYFDYTEYYTADFSSYESFCHVFGDVLTEDEFDSDDWVGVGEPETPYGDWILALKLN